MTIIVDRHRMSGDLDGYISRLESLLAHLQALRTGKHPTAAEISAAPLLDNYRPALREAECLIGNVVGHPKLRGMMTTSELWSFAPELGWARTFSSLYRLGHPAGHSDRRH